MLDSNLKTRSLELNKIDKYNPLLQAIFVQVSVCKGKSKVKEKIIPLIIK